MRSKRRYVTKILLFFSMLIFTILSQFIPVYASPDLQSFPAEGYQGFLKKSDVYIEEVGSNMLTFEHVRSGAKVVLLSNSDVNKVFSIGFKTPMSDQTGINNIILQAILSGSEKYPLKFPLESMKNRSIAQDMEFKTELDKMIFTFKSKSADDISNLADVCLDGIYNPVLIDEKAVFMKKAWLIKPRLGVNDEKQVISKIDYYGDAYTNSINSFYEKYSVIDNKIRNSLFPASPYGYNPEGTPEGVLSLSRQQFLDKYQIFMRPFNSMTYLYGDYTMNELKNLFTIFNAYFENYSKTNVSIPIELQTAFNQRKKETSYYESVSNGENNSTFTKNYVVGNLTDKEDVIGMEILMKILFKDDNSLLLKALNKNGIEFVDGVMVNDILQPYISIKAMNLSFSKLNKVDKLIDATFSGIVEKGFDSVEIASLFEAEAKKYEVQLYSQEGGITYIDAIMSGLYGIEPASALQTSKTIMHIRSALYNNEKFFENLIKKYFIDNKHVSTIIFKPKSGLNKVLIDQMKQKAELDASIMTPENWSDLYQAYRNFILWDDIEDNQSNMTILPKINLNEAAEILNLSENTQETVFENAVILKYNKPIGKSINANLYFDISTISETQIKYLNLLAGLLGDVETVDLSLAQLQEQMKETFQSISFSVRAIGSDLYPDEINPKFIVQFETEEEHLQSAFTLIKKILLDTDLDQMETIRQNIKAMKSEYDMVFTLAPESLLVGSVFAGTSKSARYNEIGKRDYYTFISELDSSFTGNSNSIRQNLSEFQEECFKRTNLLVSYTGDSSLYTNFKSNLMIFLGGLKSESIGQSYYELSSETPLRQGYEGRRTGYLSIIRGFNMVAKNYSYDGSIQVAREIFNDKLMENSLFADGNNKAIMTINKNREISIFASGKFEYDELNNALLSIAAEMMNVNYTEEEMDNYRLRALKSTYGETNLKNSILKSDTYFFWGKSNSEMNLEKEQVAGASLDEVQSYYVLFGDLITNGNLTAVGDSMKLSEIPLDSTEFILK